MTEKDILFKNDKILKRLLELKNERHHLSFSEKRRLKNYIRLFSEDIEESNLINRILLNNNLMSIDSERESSGHLLRSEIIITEKGLNALEHNHFESEIEEQKKAKSNRIWTAINALITIVLMGLSIWLERTNSSQNVESLKVEIEARLKLLENDINELKTKYAIIEKYKTAIKADTIKSTTNVKSKKSSKSNQP